MGQLMQLATYCYIEKKVEEDTNLVEKDETTDEGIFMIANEGITMDSDMVWYLETSASIHICGYKHLFVHMQEIEDGHMFFGDSTKVPIKARGKICFS